MAKTVLIVEDDELNLRFFTDLLESEGYRTRAAQTGSDALASARADPPDLILLDIELPERCGLEVAEELAADRALGAVPVVAVTAHASDGYADRIRRSGCRGHISKPVTMRGFLDAVRKFAYC